MIDDGIPPGQNLISIVKTGFVKATLQYSTTVFKARQQSTQKSMTLDAPLEFNSPSTAIKERGGKMEASQD